MYSPGADDLISPEELSSWLLQYLVRQAQTHAKEPITGAVITVPAHFNQRQRGATLAAAEAAGIGTVHLLQEPVAAALAYGIHGGNDGDTVLVFDLGGGTFDVSVLQAFEGIMEVLGTAGDSLLGGDDFDAVVANWVQEEVSGADRKWAVAAARGAKESLSTADPAVIQVPVYCTHSNGASTAPIVSELTLTREKFEQLSEGIFLGMATVLDQIGRDLLIEWAMPPITALESRGRSLNDIGSGNKDIKTETTDQQWKPPSRRITKVALVGQVTRLPSVRQFVRDITGVEPCVSVDPGDAVALGAATHAGILLGSIGSVELMDGSFVLDLHSRVTGFGEWQP